ncbi:hypothetical protein ABZV60_35860 [Streptomyces sp. NPDC004787]|uniref:hypothetical protein n=1 Tax=Streptomyces sp. NPDC004787 TaxID=3154291 RepID=UPI0033B681B4
MKMKTSFSAGVSVLALAKTILSAVPAQAVIRPINTEFLVRVQYTSLTMNEISDRWNDNNDAEVYMSLEANTSHPENNPVDTLKMGPWKPSGGFPDYCGNNDGADEYADPWGYEHQGCLVEVEQGKTHSLYEALMCRSNSPDGSCQHDWMRYSPSVLLKVKPGDRIKVRLRAYDYDRTSADDKLCDGSLTLGGADGFTYLQLKNLQTGGVISTEYNGEGMCSVPFAVTTLGPA